MDTDNITIPHKLITRAEIVDVVTKQLSLFASGHIVEMCDMRLIMTPDGVIAMVGKRGEDDVILNLDISLTHFFQMCLEHKGLI